MSATQPAAGKLLDSAKPMAAGASAGKTRAQQRNKTPIKAAAPRLAALPPEARSPHIRHTLPFKGPGHFGGNKSAEEDAEDKQQLPVRRGRVLGEIRLRCQHLGDTAEYSKPTALTKVVDVPKYFPASATESTATSPANTPAR